MHRNNKICSDIFIMKYFYFIFYTLKIVINLKLDGKIKINENTRKKQNKK